MTLTLRARFVAGLLCSLAFSSIAAAQAANSNAIVIIYAEFPGNNAYEIGTGAFVDHDGLVLTADHVIHHISMSTPSAFVQGTPTTTAPTKVVLYSAALGAAIPLNLSNPASIVGGQLVPNQWIDAALIRVPLTTDQRHQIQPLDLSQGAPPMGDVLTAYGPL